MIHNIIYMIHIDVANMAAMTFVFPKDCHGQQWIFTAASASFSAFLGAIPTTNCHGSRRQVVKYQMILGSSGAERMCCVKQVPPKLEATQ
jgi:hypothetical protein